MAAWLTEEIRKLGLDVTPSIANFVLIHFPERRARPPRMPTRSSPSAAYPARGRGLQAAERAAHDVGTEEANRLVVASLAGISWGRRRARAIVEPAGVDWGARIGSSIARAAKAQNLVRSIVATARSPMTRKRVAELGLADQVVETNAAAVAGADLVIVCVPVGACGEVAKEIAGHLQGRADRRDQLGVAGEPRAVRGVRRVDHPREGRRRDEGGARDRAAGHRPGPEGVPEPRLHR